MKMLSIGTATQDVFLTGKIFTPKNEHGTEYERLELGMKLSVDDAVFTTGGNASNAAVTFARQGLESDFMGVVGTEPAGQAVIANLDAEGVGTRFAHQSDDYRTSYSTILLAPNGERTILNFHGTSLHATGSDIALGAIPDFDWLYVSSVGSYTLLEKIVSKAAAHNVHVAFNPSSKELQEPEKLRALLDDVTILLANKEEMRLIVEGSSAEELAVHASHLVQVAVVSDGPRGVVATDRHHLVKAGMYEDVKVVDRLGAGDAFGAGFTSMFAQGKDLAACVTFASANATSVVTKIGGKAGILHKGARLHDMPLHITQV